MQQGSAERTEAKVDHLHELLHHIIRQNDVLIADMGHDVTHEVAESVIKLNAKSAELLAAVKASQP